MTDLNRAHEGAERSLDPEDWEAFRALAHRMLDSAIDHIAGVRERSVWQPVPDEVKAALAEAPPMVPQGAEKVCQDFTDLVLPYGVGNTHPRFFGWVHGAGTPSGVISEMLAAAMNANLGGRDHGAIYVERQVIEWCRQLFGFPESASGLVVSGTSMATFIALTAARYAKADYDVRHLGVQPGKSRLVGYTSAEAHSCIARTFDYMGIGQDALRLVPVDDRFRMDIIGLREAIRRDIESGNRPFCVMGAAATVNTAAMDDLEAIADVCQEHELWFHVDGAFGAVAALSNQLRPRLKGLERADSIAFDFHKWMHVQYDAGFVLLRREDLHREAFTLRREYLTDLPRGLAGGNPWFCEYGPELSRGFRALKVWFALKEHGIERIAEKVEDNCRQAAYLAELVEAHPELELSAPVSLNIVCFRYRGAGIDEVALSRVNTEIVMDLQERGVAAPSTTTLRGQSVIRVNITNHRTTRADFDLLVEEVVKAGRTISAAG
ncbi:MAG: pyridoxal-dependent decarboxylase [Pseudomonadota bacterium]